MPDTREDDLRDHWKNFTSQTEPQRMPLFRYCESLTHNPFVADDLASETLVKTFAVRAFTTTNLESQLAFMLFVASRLWRDRPDGHHLLPAGSGDSPSTRKSSEGEGAAKNLASEVAVLKEILGETNTAIPQIVCASLEAIEAAEGATSRYSSTSVRISPRASMKTLEAFVDSFQNDDAKGIKRLFAEEIDAFVFPLGWDITSNDEFAWLPAALSVRPCETRIQEVLGDRVVLVSREGAESGVVGALQEVWLFEEVDGKIGRIRDYGASPHLVEWVDNFCNGDGHSAELT